MNSKYRWLLGLCGCALTLPIACDEKPSATAGASADCAKLRNAVVAEAGKLAACETDDDCKVHRISLCDFDELDCHAAHVNGSKDTKALDDAVSAYAKSCDVNKCKCEVPGKSVCKGGKCSAE